MPKNWIDEVLPFPRPEYAKQTESLLTDLLWRSAGSNLSSVQTDGLLSLLSSLPLAPGFTGLLEPERLVPQRRPGGSYRLCETFPLAKATDVTSFISAQPNVPNPVEALLNSSLAPRARGDKSDACVPIHPAIVALQTLHGLVNKEGPSNLAHATEIMSWLGGSSGPGETARIFLELFAATETRPNEGLTGLIDSIVPCVARHVWSQLPQKLQATPLEWPEWPGVLPAAPSNRGDSLLAQHEQTPFTWFWRKWRTLCDSRNGWHSALPNRRFTDWALCLLRTGLAFSYLWEAEFFSRLHDALVARSCSVTSQDALRKVRTLLSEGIMLAAIEPLNIPASQKSLWPALSALLAKGYEARKAIYDWDLLDTNTPEGNTLSEKLETWFNTLSPDDLSTLQKRIQIGPRTANNQKEFVRYLMLPRSSDDDLVDQADFYYLARNNSRHLWFHPGPEWLVVIASLLCGRPGGQCTLGQLKDDIAALGIQVERSVLVTLLENAGLSTDSPDADNAIVIRSGF